MVLEPIEGMDDKRDNEDLKKFIKEALEGMTKQLMQGFELVPKQLMGKLAAGGSRSFHHGETHNTIHFEYFYYWLN